MKVLLALLLATQLISNSEWYTDFDKAKDEAKISHKYILLNFSGSDWCSPCIRMHKDIFASDTFTKYAASNLLLVNADFPRLRKNQLSKEQMEKNDALAEKYNRDGKFPYTVLLDSDGKVLKSWEGLPNLSPEKFVGEINSTLHAH
jgi:thioredoxin-related protein